MSTDLNESRRAHVRRLLKVDAFLTAGAGAAHLPVQIVDIARMGVGFVTGAALPDGESYTLHFCFPGCAVEHVSPVEVVYSRVTEGGRYRHGARFHALPEATVAQIVDCVTSSKWDELKHDALAGAAQRPMTGEENR